MVVGYHLNLYFGKVVDAWSMPLIGQLGHAGVDLFFVVSGAIMWYTTQGLRGPRDSAAFLYRRAVRIFPVYWFFLLAQTLVVLATNPGNLKWVNYLKAITLVPAAHYFLPVAWTLTYELIFYILFALLILLPRKKAAGIVLAMAGLAVLLAALGLDRAVHRHVSLVFFLEFFGGCAAAALALNHPGRFARLSLVLGLTAFAVAAGWQHQTGSVIAHPEWFRVATFGTASVLLVHGAIGLERSVTAPPALVRAGEWSYTMYLLHAVLITGLLGLDLPTIYGLSAVSQGAFLVASTVATVLFPALFAERVELPLYRSLRGLAWPRPAPGARPGSVAVPSPVRQGA
ncbi:MAG: acyltransferase [Pseudomonadota bacterium]|nr:acyltransferase [Pseudomonadota bacterium]